MIEQDSIQGENLEESEQGQLHAIHLHMNAVADVRRVLAEQAAKPSLSHCVECGDEIPEQRQKIIPGVQHCIYCQELLERK